MSEFVTIDLQSRMLPNPRTASLKELQDAVRSLGNVANSRLRALEKASAKVSKQLGVQVDLKNYGAYKYAVKKTQGRPATRFRTGSVGRSRRELIQEYQAITTFLGLKTSTVQGATKVLLNQYEGFIQLSKDETTPFSDFWHMYELAWADNLKEIFGSDTVEIALKTGYIDLLIDIRNRLENDFSKEGKDPYKNGNRKEPTGEMRTRAEMELLKTWGGRYVLSGTKKYRNARKGK